MPLHSKTKNIGANGSYGEAYFETPLVLSMMTPKGLMTTGSHADSMGTLSL